jgi:tetratricopeptide (TPR) repeat protein
MGKTSLITKLLHEVQSRQFTLHQDGAMWDIDGIVYATLRQPEYRTPDKLIELICRTLEPRPAQELRAKWQQRSSLTDKLDFLLRRSLAGQHYLIVLDNCEDILDADNHIREEFADLRHFVETCLEYDYGPRLLVTSRHRLVFSPELEGRLGTLQAELSLDAGLPLPDAVTLLRALDPEGRLGLRSASEVTLREVAQRCHGIPRTLETLVGTLRQRRTWTLERLVHDAAALAQLTENPARELYESLSSDARCVMQVLAVYDRPVPAAAVQALLPGLRVDDVLDTLVNHYVVAYEQGHFSLHPLDRHYAYRQLPDTEAEGTRAGLHAQAATFFRQLRTPPEHWHTIADLDPQLQEFQHLIQARLHDQACALLTGREGQALLVWGHAASLVQLRSVLVDHVRDSALQAANLDQLGEAYWRLGEAREAMRYHQQALTMSRQLGHRQQEARCLTNIGAVYWILGQPQEAREFHEQALAIFRTLSTTDDRWGEAHCLGNLGIAHQQVGEVRSAITYYEQHLQQARELGDGRGEGRALINLGFAHSDVGDLQTAMAYYEQALTVAHRIGDRWNAGRCVGNMGLVYDNMGRTQEALASFEHALVVFREIGDRRVESDLLGNIADVLVRSGNCEHAIRSYHEALTIAQEVSDRGGVSEQWLGLGYACHHLGDLTAARRAYHEGLTLAFPLTHYRCVVLLGILGAEEGHGLEAQHHYTCGIDFCRALLARTPHLFRPLYSLALAYLGNRQPHDALVTYQQALAVCSAPGVVRDALQDVQLLRRISPGIAKWDEVTQLLEAARACSTGGAAPG